MRTLTIRTVLLSSTIAVSILATSCGGGGAGSTGSPGGGGPGGGGGGGGVQAPTIFWTGDSQVSSGAIGDHGLATSGPPGVVLVPDGSGGAFLAWEDDAFEVVHTQHIDSNGHPTWQLLGVAVTTSNAYQASPRIVRDGLGGVIVAWVDGRRDGFCNPTFLGTCDIFAQRIDSTGQVLWDPAGIPIATVGNSGAGGHGIAMIPDGSNGAIISWEGGITGSIYAQRIDLNGNPKWPVNGVQVSPTPTIVLGSTGAPQEWLVMAPEVRLFHGGMSNIPHPRHSQL